jgi:predicted glutamine amidotransferase
MCRFFAFTGKNVVDLSHLITVVDNCLLDQSKNDETKRPNPDGWGFAYQKRKKLNVIKSPLPAFKDKLFLTEAQKIKSKLLFAHIRRKSHGIVKIENSHPFKSGKWMFMHNGNIPNLRQFQVRLMRTLPDEIILETKGTTDSEFLFKYFLLLLEKEQECDVNCALNYIYNIIDQLSALIDAEDLDLLALNFVLTNCDYLIGFRRNRSLFYCNVYNGTLISSEPLGIDAAWNEVPENHFIVCLNPGEVKLAALDIALQKNKVEWV